MSAAPHSGGVPGAATARRRILIVDDEEMNRAVLGSLVRAQGYMPLLAASGEEALGLLGPEVALVLLDVMMPGLDGYQTARAIRSGSLVPDVPIVMCTTLDGRDDRRRAVEAGADDFLTKPVACAEFRARLERHLGVSRPCPAECPPPERGN